jgi:hypothetical protein
MSEYNPYRDYRAGEWWNDAMLKNDIPGKDEHLDYYNNLPGLIKRLDPKQDVTKIDRGLMDMVMNYMGGYDMMARAPERKNDVQALAKAYQYGDYGSRPNDSIGDFWENIAGVNAYDPQVGRLSDIDLYNQAMQFAKDRIAAGEGKQYENYGNDYLGAFQRTTPWVYGKTVDKLGGLLEKLLSGR